MALIHSRERTAPATHRDRLSRGNIWVSQIAYTLFVSRGDNRRSRFIKRRSLFLKMRNMSRTRAP